MYCVVCMLYLVYVTDCGNKFPYRTIKAISLSLLYLSMLSLCLPGLSLFTDSLKTCRLIQC